MKVVFGIVLMLVSSTVLASFQNQLSVEFLNEEKGAQELDKLMLDYLFLYSSVEDSAIPYAEQIFVSQIDNVSLGVENSKKGPIEGLFPGDTLEIENDIYKVNGLFHISGTSFYVGLGYQRSRFESKANIASGNSFSSFIVSLNAKEGPEAAADTVELHLGHYINPMSRVSILLSRTDIEHDGLNLDVDFDNKFYGISYRQLLTVDKSYFSFNAVIGVEKAVANSSEFGNLGFDDESKNTQLHFNYYINKSTSVGASIGYIKNEVLDPNEEENTMDYSLSVQHYFDYNLYASIGYFDSEANESDGYNLNMGYRF